MDKLVIQGGVPLNGEIRISGAKNAALPILCAGLLADGTVAVRKCAASARRHHHDRPARPDGRAAFRWTTSMASRCARKHPQSGSALRTGENHARRDPGAGADAGPLRRARVSLPGGCAIGSRPVDLHIKGLQAMGAEHHHRTWLYPCALQSVCRVRALSWTW